MTSSLQSIKRFSQTRGKLMAQIVAALLLLIALFWLAKLVWLWVEYFQPKQTIAPATVTTTSNPARKVNVEPIVAKHLFGQANQVQEQQIEAQETRLNLVLMGTFVSSNEQASSAIIQSNGKEKAYMVGAKLEVRGNVTLHQVETQKVIIKNAGRYETLTLVENINPTMILSEAEPATEEDDQNARVIDKRRDSRLSQDLGQMREQLYNDPQSLAQMANFERVIDDTGMVAGYKISPGKDPRMFARMGLRRNDIVRSINGSPLNEQGYLGIIDEINNAQSLEIDIERNGQTVTLMLNLSEAASQPEPIKPDLRNRNEIK